MEHAEYVEVNILLKRYSLILYESIGVYVYLICILKAYTLMKPLPFRGYRKKYQELKKVNGEYVGNYYISSNYSKILNMLKIINLKMPSIKQVVVDDKR